MKVRLVGEVDLDIEPVGGVQMELGLDEFGHEYGLGVEVREKCGFGVDRKNGLEVV